MNINSLEDLSLSVNVLFLRSYSLSGFCSAMFSNGAGHPIITCPLHFDQSWFSVMVSIYFDKGYTFTFSSGHKDSWNAVRGYTALRKSQQYVL